MGYKRNHKFAARVLELHKEGKTHREMVEALAKEGFRSPATGDPYTSGAFANILYGSRSRSRSRSKQYSIEQSTNRDDVYRAVIRCKDMAESDKLAILDLLLV